MATCPEGYTLFDGQSNTLRTFTQLISFNTYATTDRFALLYRRISSTKLRILLYAVYDSDIAELNRYFLCGFDIVFSRAANAIAPTIENIHINPVLIYMYLHTEGESLGSFTPLISRMLPAIVHEAVRQLIVRNGVALQNMFRFSNPVKEGTPDATSSGIYQFLYSAIPETRSRRVAQRNENEVYGNVYNRRSGASKDIMILMAITVASAAAAILTYKAVVSK